MEKENVSDKKSVQVNTIEFNIHDDMFTLENIKLLFGIIVKDIIYRKVCFKYGVSGRYSVVTIYIPTQDLEIRMLKNNTKIVLRFNRISENCFPYEFSDDSMNEFLLVVFDELSRYYWDAYLHNIDTQISSYTRIYNSEWKSEIVDMLSGRIVLPNYAERRKDRQVFNDLIACYLNKEYQNLADSKFENYVDNVCSKNALLKKISDAQKQLYSLEKSMGITELEKRKNILSLKLDSLEKRIEKYYGLINIEDKTNALISDYNKLKLEIKSYETYRDKLTGIIKSMEKRKAELEKDINELEEKRIDLKIKKSETPQPKKKSTRVKK